MAPPVSRSARAVLSGAGYNVRINVASLSDSTPGIPLIDAVRLLEAQADQIETQVRQDMSDRGGISLP